MKTDNKKVLLHIADILWEKGYLNETERTRMKRIINDGEKMCDIKYEERARKSRVGAGSHL